MIAAPRPQAQSPKGVGVVRIVGMMMTTILGLALPLLVLAPMEGWIKRKALARQGGRSCGSNLE